MYQLTDDGVVSVFGQVSHHDDAFYGLHGLNADVWRMSVLEENGLGLDHGSNDGHVGHGLGLGPGPVAVDFSSAHVVLVSHRPFSVEVSMMKTSPPSIIA